MQKCTKKQQMQNINRTQAILENSIPSPILLVYTEAQRKKHAKDLLKNNYVFYVEYSRGVFFEDIRNNYPVDTTNENNDTLKSIMVGFTIKLQND